MCYCCSLKAGRKKKGKVFWLALAKVFAAGSPRQAGISEEEIIICTLLPQICLYSKIREHLKVAARAAAVPSTAFPSGVFLPEQA